MLAREVVLEIHRLLDADRLSHRAIARKMNVSRGTVDAIANGQRGLHGRDPEDENPRKLRIFAARPTRCRCCGGMVYHPCMLCAAREFRRREEEQCVA